MSGMFEWTLLTRIQNLLERRRLEKLPNKLRDLVSERDALQFGSLLKVKVCISLQTYIIHKTTNNESTKVQNPTQYGTCMYQYLVTSTTSNIIACTHLL